MQHYAFVCYRLGYCRGKAVLKRKLRVSGRRAGFIPQYAQNNWVLLLYFIDSSDNIFAYQLWYDKLNLLKIRAYLIP